MSSSNPEMKITYATMSADQMETLHRGIDEAIERVKAQLGKTYPMYIDGESIESAEQFEDLSPNDTRVVLARFQKGTADHVRDAVRAARVAAAGWGARSWMERVAIVRKIGDGIRAQRWELAAWMGYETGKNRLECVGDIEEAADFMTYYCDQMEAHDGFCKTMDKLEPNEENTSVMRPHGVWAVISPFNFPMALAAGPAGGALVAGNTVLLKPSSDTPRLGLRLYDIATEAGVPPGVFNIVTGPGNSVGQEIAENAGIDGIVFTGSKEVGMMLSRENGGRPAPRPVITEMGGKNPALVMSSADLDKATEGVWRSAFGAQGQKCSACSRVYVAADVCDRFVEELVEKTRKIKIGNPLERDVWMGPVINEAAVKTYERAIEEAKRDGGRVLTGGRRMAEEPFRHGFFLEPTVIDGLPNNHRLFTDELFVPITVVGKVTSFDEAIRLANKTEYGLTAGIFSGDEDEIANFFDEVQAGVVYANRQAGATTGAWPGINPFGGWKASGSSGRGAGGPYYVQQFLKEQSRVRIY